MATHFLERLIVFAVAWVIISIVSAILLLVFWPVGLLFLLYCSYKSIVYIASSD